MEYESKAFQMADKTAEEHLSVFNKVVNDQILKEIPKYLPLAHKKAFLVLAVDADAVRSALSGSLSDTLGKLSNAERRLKIYADAVNEIDDYFEYRHESEKDNDAVMAIIDGITEKLKDKP